RCFQLVGAVEFERHQRDSSLCSRGLGLAPLRYVEGIFHIDQRSQARQTRQEFAHEVDLLGGQLLREIGQAGDVTAGTRQAFHQSEGDWPAPDAMTIGIVCVALATAMLAGTGDETMTRGLSLTNSAAKPGRRSR